MKNLMSRPDSVILVLVVMFVIPLSAQDASKLNLRSYTNELFLDLPLGLEEDAAIEFYKANESLNSISDYEFEVVSHPMLDTQNHNVKLKVLSLPDDYYRCELAVSGKDAYKNLITIATGLEKLNATTQRSNISYYNSAGRVGEGSDYEMTYSTQYRSKDDKLIFAIRHANKFDAAEFKFTIEFFPYNLD